MGAITVRPDIYEKHKSLFGDKTVNGRRINVEDLIAQLTRATKDEFRTLLSARHAYQQQVGRRERSYGFLAPEVKIADADGNTATVRDIRQGMLDGFFGRKTPHAWRLNPSLPIPPDTMKPGLEGTGPAIDLGMAMGALNTGAASWMWDWEDAGGDYKDQLYQAWENLRDLLADAWTGKPYTHPSKKDGGKPRQYTIDLPPAKWPTIFHRVPGLHLQNRQIALDGEQVPGMIPALVIHAVSNYDTQKKRGSGVYYYVPKIETWQEARLVSQLLKRLEQALGLARGSLKIKMLNERAEYALQQEAIMWVLRENLIGPNVGRWDYLNSREEMFRHDPQMVIPDPNTVTMTEPSLTYYTMRNALLALLAGGMPIGGMAAQMQNPGAPENDAKALRDIWFDKLRERLTGLFTIDGTLHDMYRQSWVATIAPAYVEAGREPIVTEAKDLQTVVDKLRPDEKKRLEDLGLLKGGKISPMELTESDLVPDKLFSEDARKKLLSRPQGPTTEDGLRYAMYMSTEFMYQQLLGNNAAAIYDPRTGLRFMNDLATYEIFWHFLYLTVFHGVELTADGKYSKKGDRVTPELFLQLLDERRATVKELFAKLGTVYEKTNAELVLTILKRQVVDTTPDGRVVPQPRWIKYGSRVLLSIIEEKEADRSAILDGIFGEREDLVRAVEQSRDPARRALAEKVLRAHDFVYDTREEQTASAA
jgi:malate synthase